MISKKTKYALHALVYLGQHRDGPVLISDIAEQKSIPKKFLESILLDLKRAGILASKMGKGGGYYLLREPSEINLAEIIRLFDGAIGLIPCVTHRYYEPCAECPDEALCGLHRIFHELKDHTLEMMKRDTLARIIEKEGST